MKKRVVIFAHQCKPFQETGREVASRRAFYFARYLPDFDWDCTVFCASTETAERIVSGDGWRIVGVPQGELPVGRKLWRALMIREAGGIVRRGLSWWYSRRGDNSVAWAGRAVARALEIHRREPFDAIVGEHSPDGGVLAAHRFYKHTRLPYCLDVRDPVGIMHLADAGKLAFFQNRAGVARAITTTTASWIEPFEKIYGIQTWAIPNGYDAGEMNAVPPATFDKNTIVHTGSTYESQLEYFTDIAAALNASDGSLRFWSAGYGAHRIRHTFGAAGALAHAEIFDHVTAEQALAAQKGAAAILIVGHDYEVVSARLFEHIASGTPVIYFPADGREQERRLRCSGARFRVVKDVHELSRLFNEIAAGRAHWERRENSSEQLSPHTRLQRAQRLGQVLDGICGLAPYPPKTDFEVDETVNDEGHTSGLASALSKSR
ncbi:MAG: hypothetical protein ABR577_05650 [Pyrinomonadaceae bacterium]